MRSSRNYGTDIIEGSACISFLSFDPHPEEVEECKRRCAPLGIEYKYFSNAEIADLLDKKYHDLRYKYLKIESPTTVKARPEHFFTVPTSDGSPARSAEKINQVAEWRNSPDELKSTLESIHYFYNSLKNLNEASRRFFCSLVELAEPFSDWYDNKLRVPYQEVANSLGLENREINNQIWV